MRKKEETEKIMYGKKEEGEGGFRSEREKSERSLVAWIDKGSQMTSYVEFNLIWSD